MTSRFEEVRALLASDKRFVEVTVLFNGQNLKEQFPELTWEERAQLSRIARSTLAQLNGGTPHEKDSEETQGVLSLDARGEFDRPDSRVGLSTGQPKEDSGRVARAGSLEGEEGLESYGAKGQATGQSGDAALPEAQAAPDPQGLHAEPVKARVEGGRWLFFIGLIAIIAVGVMLIMLQLPWLADEMLGWMSERVNTVSSQLRGQTSSSPQPGDIAKPTVNSGEQKEDVPNSVGQIEPPVPAGESIRSAPEIDRGQFPSGGLQDQNAPTPVAQTGADSVDTPSAARQSQAVPASQANDSTTPAGEDIQAAPEAAAGALSADEIREVQATLSRLGYQPGPIDGILGPRTSAAIRAFQQANHLAVDGQISPVLMQALAASSPR